MKKQTLLWLPVLALVLSAAFLGPRLLLRREQLAVLQARRRLDASAYRLESEAGGCLRRLALLNDPATQSIPFSTELPDRSAAQQALQAELTRLAELGAVPASLPEQAVRDAEDLAFQRICVVNPEQSALFEVYQLSAPWSEFTAVLDKASGKLLALSYGGDPAATQLEALLRRPNDSLDQRLAEAWAAYYGAEATLPDALSGEEPKQSGQYFPAPIQELLCLRLREDGGDPVLLILRYAEDPLLRLFWSGEAAGE